MIKYFPLCLIFCLFFTSISNAGENDAIFRDLQIELGTLQAGYFSNRLLSEIPENKAYKTQIWQPSKLGTFQKYEWVEIVKISHDKWKIQNPETGGRVEFSVSYEDSELKIFKTSSHLVKNTTVSKDSTFPVETEFTLSGGYRNDNLDWNIAGDINGNNPNILSELTWDDLESYQMKFQGTLVWPNIIALRGSINYGWIFDGDNQDSDYLGNNRTFEFSRSNNSTDDRDMWDVSGAIGFPFRWGQTVIATITPLAGYSYHKQNLTVTDLNQTIPNLGPFPGLDSTYETEWKGPWIGFDIRFKAKEIKTFAHQLEPYLTCEYHWANYHADADWNLRKDFAHPKSFEHDADGNGYLLSTGFNLALSNHWALNFNFDYQNWSTDDGTDKVFFADGTTKKTRLNEVNWTSYAINLGIAVRF